ncbi:MAG: PASTA domain-containing protein [Planctomycetota bacterium]|jgi:beta-lactam-binding protein with PASTA domain
MSRTASTVLLLIAALVFVLAAVPAHAEHARREAALTEAVLVPSVRGLRYGAAERQLLDLGLVPVPHFVPTLRPAATGVMHQSPQAGTALRPGDRVELRVAWSDVQGRRVRVPSLHGLDTREAMSILRQLGLRGRPHRVPALFAPGTVFTQRPHDGERVERGTVIRFGVATNEDRRRIARLRVPALEGGHLSDVWAAAREHGFQVEIRRRLAPDHAADEVVGQRPPAGAELPVGGRVVVDLPLLTEVPHLEGLSLRAARRVAAEAGLQLDASRHPTHAGRSEIARQDVPAGAAIARGSHVHVVLRRIPMAVVPDLHGLTVEAARERLLQAGLRGRFEGPRTGVRSRRTGRSQRGGLAIVTRQDVPARTRVERGTEVIVHYRWGGFARPHAGAEAPVEPPGWGFPLTLRRP